MRKHPGAWSDWKESNINQYKTCTLCKVKKSLDFFHNDSSKPDGKTTRCASCRNILENAYRIDIKEGVWVSKKKPKLSQQQIQLRRRVYGRKINTFRVFRNATTRAKKFGAFIGLFTKPEIKAFYSSSCFYCGSNERISIDHVVPLARGGNHTVGNLVSCCGSCNSSKGNKMITEWKMSELRA